MSDRPPRPLQFGQTTELDVLNLAFGGEGVARLDGFAVFVPGALPGERVRVKVTEVKDRWARARVTEVLRPSPRRVVPPCPIFHECGGCQWQHFSAEGQLEAKRQAVEDSIGRIGKLEGVRVEGCLPSPEPYGYRNKALPVVSMRGGHFIAGIYEPRSHTLVPYAECLIQSEAINRLVQKALAKVEAAGLTPYQSKSHTGFLRHLVVRHGRGTGEMLLAFVTREAVPGDRLTRPEVAPPEGEGTLQRIAGELMDETPGLVGVLQNINPSRTNIVLGPETRLLRGETHFREKFDGLTLRVSLHSFLQVNTHQAERLHAEVRRALGRPAGRERWGTVLDLFSGIGTLALAVADSAERVLGVEEVAPAVEDARENARLNGKTNLEFLQGDASRVFEGLRSLGWEKVEAVLLDPPRKGVASELLNRLAALGPERIVYVSCDPSTLARDLAILTRQGYRVDAVQPLDMFPQTYHVESVASLTRVTPPIPPTGTPGGGSPAETRPVDGTPSAPSEGPSAAPMGGRASGLLFSWRRWFTSREPPRPAVVSTSSLPPSVPSRPSTIRKKLKAALWILLLAGLGVAGWATLRPGRGEAILSFRSREAALTPELPEGIVKRYDNLTFAVRRSREAQAKDGAWTAVAQVYRCGRLVTTVGRRSVVRLRPESEERRLVGHWPVPYNPPPGTYLSRLTVMWAKPRRTETFTSAFTIPPLAPHLLEPGFAALTFEGGQRMDTGRIPPLDGEGADAYRHVADWTRFLGADALVYLGAQTSVWGEVHSREFPFDRVALDAGHRYGLALHDAGLKLGIYMTTFRVVGDAWAKAPYRFATGYDREEDHLRPIDFVSLYDKTRQDQIVDLLRRLQGDEAVDFVGFDYVRTGTGGYEMVDEFVRDMDLPVPEGFSAWSPDDRSLWLARRVEKAKDPDTIHLFEWWRAHKVALILKDMLARARVTKPVMTFTLGWEMGHQHGQDPSMYVDAGVGINQIMLYQRGPEQVVEMNDHWPPYLDRGNGMYVLGEMVDFNWVQHSIHPPGPQELYDREVGTFGCFFPHNASLGMYWHDLYRLLHGAKGPYTTMEWAVAGGKAFTFMRQAEGVTPLLTRIEAPKEVPPGMPFTFSVDLWNRSGKDLEGLSLVQLDPAKQTYSELERVGPFNLPAGSRVRVSNLKGLLPEGEVPERDNRWMVAVVVGRKNSREDRAFDFTYVKSLTHEEAQERLDVVKAFQEKSSEVSKAVPILSKPRWEESVPQRKGARKKARPAREPAAMSPSLPSAGVTEINGKP